MNKVMKRNKHKLLKLGRRGTILGKHISRNNLEWRRKGTDCKDCC